MPRVCTPRGKPLAQPVIPRPGQLAELYAELSRLPNVQGCYVGFKRRQDRTSRQVSVVVCVSEKRAKRALGPAHRIPSRLKWQATSRRTRSIPTDVRVIRDTRFHAAVLGAGDGVDGFSLPGGTNRPAEGTIGAAMVHPVFGKVVTTAGHVLGFIAPVQKTFAPGQEPRVRLRNAGNGPAVIGLARKVSLGSESDYAIVSPPEGLVVENLYQDQQPLALPHAPGPGGLGKPVFVLARQTVLAARLDGIHGTLQIGNLVLHDLLLTKACTVGGDSGACLVDAESRLLGFVEGVTALDGKLVSVYTSAAWPFIRENGVFF